jgi:hypothetical protein
MFSILKIMRPNLLLILLISMMCLVGCETTGDPAQGGLFGWSQSKADQRVYEKQRELYRVQADNNRQQQRSSALRSSYDSLR